MEKLFEQLIEAVKKNHEGLKSLKHTVVMCQQYELASKLREIEREAFPETIKKPLEKGKLLFTIKIDAYEKASSMEIKKDGAEIVYNQDIIGVLEWQKLDIIMNRRKKKNL